LPDGTELVDAIEFHRHAATLANGFYYKQIAEGDTAAEQEWRDARLHWNRALRKQIVYIGRAGIDSPARVVAAVEAGVAHPEVQAAWTRWCAVRDAVRLVSTPVWLDTRIVEDAARRVLAQDHGLLWYSASRALEPVLRDLMPVHGAGSEAPAPTTTHAALSIYTHGTGKNLQPWSWQLVLDPPSSGRAWEQLLGRTHRRGQEADEVICEVAAHAWPLRANIAAARMYAEYVAATSGKSQKLLVASIQR